MKWISHFESFAQSDTLLIVDVQKSFSKFFTDKYLRELNKYCNNFTNVYQIWDNHVHGTSVDKDYLYHDDPDTPISNDIYTFPNQRDLIEKRYNYDVNADFYKKILSRSTYKEIKEKERLKTLKEGDIFLTEEDTYIVYVGNKHKWFHVPRKLSVLFKQNKNKIIYIVGGSDSECLEDIFVAAQSLGVKIKRNHSYIYSANHCPIK
jgi:hypothetical protein